MINSIILSGRAVAEPESVKLTSGGVATRFAIACNGFKQADGSQETLFIDVKTFGKGAESVGKYVKKGMALIVRGRLHQFKFTNKKNNQEVKGFEVISEQVEFAEPKPAADATKEAADDKAGL